MGKVSKSVLFVTVSRMKSPIPLLPEKSKLPLSPVVFFTTTKFANLVLDTVQTTSSPSAITIPAIPGNSSSSVKVPLFVAPVQTILVASQPTGNGASTIERSAIGYRLLKTT